MSHKEFRWDLGDTVALVEPDKRNLKMPGKVVALTIDTDSPRRTFASVLWACDRRTVQRESALRRA